MSAIRDVPDSQELWLDEASDVSLIVEFVEHMPHVAVRAQARVFGGACCASAPVNPARSCHAGRRQRAVFLERRGQPQLLCAGGAAQPRAVRRNVYAADAR